MDTGGAVTPVVTDTAFWAATAIFALSFLAIVTEAVHRTVAALAGAVLMLTLGILSQREAFHVEEYGVDWNVVFLLISMMVIINIMKPTGVFEYIAIKGTKLGKGSPVRILVLFSVITALLSALLDNVTTVLLVAPVTLLVADELEVDAVPFLLSCALASNIGGAATLVGDPPNIMIASKAGLTFMDFVYNLAPVIAMAMGLYIFMVWLFWGRKLVTRDDLKARIMAMDEREAIKDPVLAMKAAAVLVLVLAGFVFQGRLHFPPATVALFGAALLLVASGARDPRHVLSEVEWPSIFFFIGLFIIVGGVVKVGLISLLSAKLFEMTRGSMFMASMGVMWLSAFASAFVDNIPYVAAMNPLVVDMAKQAWPALSGEALTRHPDLMPVWWSLALGSCLGGNGTAIGASANIMVVGMAEKAGRRVSFGRFLLYGMPVMVMTVALSTVYIWLRYYAF